MGHGGKRNNAGRPKGKANPKTLEKLAVQAAFNQRAMEHADSLFNAQLKLATGSQRVFRIDEVKDSKGKVLKREHVWVTDVDEIKALLDEHEGDSGTVDEKFYYFQTVMPDNRALDSLLNRSLGKPQESISHSGSVEVTTRVVKP